MDVLRKNAKVTKAHVDTLFTIIKEKETDLLSRGGKLYNKVNRTPQLPCHICNASDHIKCECKQKCRHCQKTGHRHKDCYSLKKKDDNNKSRGRSKSRADNKKKPTDNKKKLDSKNQRVESDSEEKDSGPESASGEDNKVDHDNRRLIIDKFSAADISSTVRRLAEAEQCSSHRGDTSSSSHDTPSFLGTISKSRKSRGRAVEEQAIPDSGCMVTVIPMIVVKDHSLPVYQLDQDEPGMKGYTGGAVPLLGQNVFWYKPRHFRLSRPGLKSCMQDLYLTFTAIISSH